MSDEGAMRDSSLLITHCSLPVTVVNAARA
jgi:hypothetical protein